MRYFLCAEAGLALVIAIVVRGLEPVSLRVGSAAIYAAITVLAYSRGHHVLEDWRGVSAMLSAEIDASTPVLLNGGFVEGGDVAWLTLPAGDDRREFLAAPASYYPLTGTVSLLPFRLDDETRAYLEREIVPVVEGVDRFACVWRQRRDPWVKPWFDGRFGPAGYVGREIYASQALNAMIYERAPR